MNYLNKIILGTVQFGLDYGINNDIGKPNYKEVKDILSLCHEQNITILDTASSYGTSQEVIGKYHSEHTDKFQIISKIKTTSLEEINTIFENSLYTLQIDSFYAYLIHDFSQYRQQKEILSFLQKKKGQGKIKKIGFSLYYPYELEYLLDNNIPLDIVQVPFNLFDRRFAPYFEKIKERGIELHTRSAFLQGLFFKDPHSLPDYFSSAFEKINNLQLLSQINKIPVFALAFDFALMNPHIDNVLVGVSRKKHLEEIFQSTQYLDNVKLLLPKLEDFVVTDETVLVPLTWPPKEKHD